MTPLSPSKDRTWLGQLLGTVLGNLSAIIALFVIAIPATVWWFSEAAKEFIEGNSYRIESTDRYAIPAIGFARLMESQTTRVVLPSEALCSDQARQASAAAIGADTFPGVLTTIRFMRRASTTAINFRITSGHVLFIAMQGGDLPHVICLRKDEVHIEYAQSDMADISPKERVLFIQTDEPASDIESNTLSKRSSAYFAVESLVGVCMLAFFVGLLVLISRNGHHDRRFEKTANLKLDKLDTDVSDLKKKQALLEDVMRESLGIKEILERSGLGRTAKEEQDQRVSFQELKQQGAAEGERLFDEWAADPRRRFGRDPKRATQTGPRGTDPRAKILEMKSDVAN